MCGHTIKQMGEAYTSNLHLTVQNSTIRSCSKYNPLFDYVHEVQLALPLIVNNL